MDNSRRCGSHAGLRVDVGYSVGYPARLSDRLIRLSHHDRCKGWPSRYFHSANPEGHHRGQPRPNYRLV